MRDVLKYAFIILAGIAILAGFFYKSGTFGKKLAQGVYLEYQDSSGNFKPTDPALIGYDEIKKININLTSLHAIAVNSNDNMIVSGDSELIFLQSDGREISRHTLSQPVKCLAVSPDGRIYLGMSDRVQVMNRDGSVISEWQKIKSNAMITSIAATETHVFVADAGNKVVLRYNTSGELLGLIGERDMKKGKIGFVIPSPYFDVAIGYEGFLWVVNSGRHALENYTFDGELRSSWERTSMNIDGFCGCCNPSHIAILPNGAFVTSEKGIPRVKIHDQTGEFRTVVAGPEYFAEGTVGLDLAVDSQERILVLDPKARMVRIFAKKQKS